MLIIRRSGQTFLMQVSKLLQQLAHPFLEALIVGR